MFGVAALLAATLVVPGVAPTPLQPATTPLPSAATDLHEIGVVGVQGISRVNGRTTRARAGTAELDGRVPVPVDGYFRMGSNTKTFTSVVVLQLVGEGKLSLDDTVERRLPGVVKGNGNDGRRITVRQLLQHTSGLFNYTNDFPALASYDSYLAHRFDHYDAEDLVAIAMKHPPVFAPGTSWDYSNTNYILAGMIIERTTGRPWATEVRERILRPLGLKHTSDPGDRASLPRPHANGYQQWTPDGPLTDTTLLNPTAAGAAGGLVTTPSDLARFWQALQQGRLLKPRQMAQMHQTVLATTWQQFLPGSRYGLGIQFLPNRCGGYWSHGGDVPGSQTRNAVSADGKRVAVLSLTTQLASERASAVDSRVLRLMDDVVCGPA
ncbi:beta-lactamase family protein [Actinoplanes sp. LDG1-06]|uniref:Beta-lactamase family protein n=1 Tax=Paractinoplanes ovalisporus TaxID=2810368 RepID=A0ABS2AKD6_9ACTN|nr:serine hydrolase domain-containing protein [Actinoplanes ovalisporus]MBM2620266.1 beta-lactamase family protein [Actinoplanes ovalisporus]